MYIKRLRRGAHAANHFAAPEGLAKYCDPAVLKFADRAKRVALVSGLIRVQPTLRKFAGERSVFFLHSNASTKPKRFCFEALKNLLQLFLSRLRNHHTARTGVAKGDLLCRAEIADTIEVTIEINDEGLVAREQRKNRRPELRGLFSANRFAAFGFQDFHADGFDVHSEVERFHIQRKLGKIESIFSG